MKFTLRPFNLFKRFMAEKKPDKIKKIDKNLSLKNANRWRAEYATESEQIVKAERGEDTFEGWKRRSIMNIYKNHHH